MASENKDTGLMYVSMSETPTYIGRPQLVHLMNDRESAVPFSLPLSLTTRRSRAIIYFYLAPQITAVSEGGKEGGRLLPSFLRPSLCLSVCLSTGEGKGGRHDMNLVAPTGEYVAPR